MGFTKTHLSQIDQNEAFILLRDDDEFTEIHWPITYFMVW